MARVLVTGGAGYVGSHCCKALAAAGHEVVVFDNLLFGHRVFVRWGPMIQADVRDGSAVEAAFRAHRFDAVLHFAALAYVGQSVAAPGDFYDVNINGTRVLLDAMTRAGVPALVFSSTCAVYGEPETVPITEANKLAPINPYGFTKFVCERMMDDFGRAHGLRSVRLRYFNAAGADPDGEIGEDHDPETHLIPLVLDAAMGLRPAIDILGTDYPTPDGTAVRDYVHVADLALAHVAALDYLLRGEPTVVINLGTGSGASVREVIDAASTVAATPVPTRIAERRPGDPAMLVADARRAREILRWSPRRSGLETIVGDAWRWHGQRFGAKRDEPVHFSATRTQE